MLRVKTFGTAAKNARRKLRQEGEWGVGGWKETACKYQWARVTMRKPVLARSYEVVQSNYGDSSGNRV